MTLSEADGDAEVEKLQQINIFFPIFLQFSAATRLHTHTDMYNANKKDSPHFFKCFTTLNLSDQCLLIVFDCVWNAPK